MTGIAVDSTGNVYVTGQSTVTKVTPTGVVSTFATLTKPTGVVVDSSNNIYVTDSNRMLKFTPTGVMTVLAGSKTSGFENGVGASARFNDPQSLAIGSDGGLYVADTYNHCVRKVNLTTAEVTTYAGSGYGSAGSASATFGWPSIIAAAAENVFYVMDEDSDTSNQLI